MASTAELAVGASSYPGNPILGGGSFGSFQLNLKPVEDLARYTMLYNKTLFDQRQKDAEAAANEIADYTSYDLTTGIPKDAKSLQEKYDKIIAYARENPGATDYRNKEEWAKFKVMRNDLENDLRGAKVRNTMWALRQKEIQDETNQATKDLLQKELDAEIAATDIRTPIKYSQQFSDPTIKLPDAPELSFDVIKTGPNGIVTRDLKLFNMSKANANGDIFEMGLEEVIDPSTPEGARKDIARKNNFWLQGAESLNAVINAQDAQGDFIYKNKVTDQSGNVTWVLDESKLSKLPRSVLNLVKETNNYIKKTREEIKAGVYLDKFEKPITFGPGALDEADYQEIDFNDGIDGRELAIVSQYAKWKGDSYSTKVTETDDAIQQQQMANQLKIQRIQEAGANYRALLASGKDDTPTGEVRKLMDLTGHTGTLSIADMAAINPTFVTSQNGVLKLTPQGIAAQQNMQILPNGDVKYTETIPTGSGKDRTQKAVEKVVTKDAYQKNAVTVTMTTLKDRKGEEGNPFTFTGLSATGGGAATPSEYTNVTVLKDKSGKEVEAGVKDGEWYNIKTGKKL